MPRIPLADLQALTTEQQFVVDAIRGAGGRNGRLPAPYHLSLANPEFTDAWQRMGSLLRYRNSLPLHLNELAILVTARHWNCAYAWQAHEPVAIAEGLSADIVEDIRWGRPPPLASANEKAVFAYASQLHESRTVSPAAHQAVLDCFGLRGIVDLTALLGYYTMVAMALNAHAYLPPDGQVHYLPDLPSDNRRFTSKE
jgi:4-carboxymuconolactone decarboxylase